MIHRFAYPAVVNPDENDTVFIIFPDVPEAMTNGRNAAEALDYAVDALTVALSLYIDDDRDIPRPSRPKRGQPIVAVEPLAAVKLAIYQAMREAGITQAALAARMKVNKKIVQRILDLDHQSTIEQLENALAALGKELVIEVRDAA